MLAVGVAGFEPAAFRSQSGRATKLRHTPCLCSINFTAAHAGFGVHEGGQ